MLFILFLIFSLYGIFGFLSLFLQRNGISYSKKFPILALYNLIITSFLIQFFSIYIDINFLYPNNFVYITIVLTLILLFLFGGLVNKKLPIPKYVKDKYKHTFIFNFDKKYLFTKISDVYFQQSFIFIFIYFLMTLNLSYINIIIIFSLIFIITHTFLLIFMGSIALFHIIMSVIPSLVFVLLILFYPYGYIYSFCFHLLGYLFFRILVWKKYSGFKLSSFTLKNQII